MHTDLGTGLQREEIRLISMAAIMHDVGKIAIIRRDPEQTGKADGRGIRDHEDTYRTGRPASGKNPPAPETCGVPLRL